MKSTKKTVTVAEAAALIASKNSIALFAHTNPDGDTLGASVALAVALRNMRKSVSVFCDTPVGDKLLANFTELGEIKGTFDGKYDFMIAVDCGDLSRLGTFSPVYDRFAETLTVDHHGGSYYSKCNLVTNYASTCQMVYEILKELRLTIDKDIATYLYMGLCTDTGNFSHNNTDKNAFLMAADMWQYGAQTEKVNRVFFKDTTLVETQLLGRAISRLRSYFDGRLIVMYLTQADLKEFGATLDETSGIVQTAINVDTALAGVMLTEYSPNVYKISMRGKDFDVRNVCNQFGGGGHKFASGCMIGGFLEDVIEKIVRAVGFEL